MDLSTFNKIKAKNSIRFIGIVIDIIIYYLILLIIVIVFDFDLRKVNSSTNGRLIGLIIFGYYSLEYFTGKTVGKYILKTSVISVRNFKKPTFKQYIIRTVFRIIPLEFLFIFFSDKLTMHDRESKTIVVDDHKFYEYLRDNAENKVFL